MKYANQLIIIICFVLFSSAMIYGQNLLTEQAPLPCIDKKFTIVAHIVKDTFGNPGVFEETITESLSALNEVFAPICASFEICEFRYIDNFQYNLTNESDWEELQVKYHQDNRINIFFVELIDNTPTKCGFASLAGITNTNSGGIVIKKECADEDSGTIIHEMGHFFGLLHTFEGNGTELVDGSNCETEGDAICDTPADPFVTGEDMKDYIDEDNECRFISPKLDANGQFYEPDVGNFMSYYPCRCGFTHGQFLRMANTYLADPTMW